MSRRPKIEQMLQKEPRDVFLNFSLAMELAKEGQTDAAVSQFDRVLELDPAYTSAHFQKATTLINAGRIPDARNALTAGIAAAQRLGDFHTVGEMQGVLDGLG